MDSYGTGKENGTDQGYFYISYDDATLGSQNMMFEPVVYLTEEQTDNYSHLYTNSSAGFENLIFLFDEESLEESGEKAQISAVQIFESGDEEEVLRAVGYATFSGELQYEISAFLLEEGEEFSEELMESGGTLLKNGYDKYGGFHTARLNSGFLIPAHTRFAVMVTWQAENANQIGMGITENSKDGSMAGLTGWDGRSYVYLGGKLIETSSDGAYPYVLAYTYGTGEQRITALDIREHTDSNAVRKEESVAAEETFSTREQGLERRRSAKYEGMKAIEAEDTTNYAPLDLTFPERYDLRDERLVTVPKHQGISNQCWAFATVAAMESSYLKQGSNLINYPKGLALSPAGLEEEISGGVMDVKLEKGEARTISLQAELMTESGDFQPETDQIFWEVSAAGGSFEMGSHVTESKEAADVFTILEPGIYTVTATSLADTYLMASCTFIATEKIPAAITLDRETLNLKTGETYQLTPVVTAEEELTVVYSSDNPSAAEVSADGKILALRAGTAVITARAGDAFAKCTVTVTRAGSAQRPKPASGRDGGGKNNGTASTVPADTITGKWEQNETGWWFAMENGGYPASSWQRIGGKWYYFKADGYMAVGWLSDPATGIWYYLAPGGAMSTGWRYDESYKGWFWMDESGAMKTGWQKIGGKWYYFQEVSDGNRGLMYENRTTPDGYPVGADGAFIP